MAGFKKIVRDETVRAQFVRVQTERGQTVRVQKCTKSTLKCTRLAVYEIGSVRVESVQVRLCDFEVYELTVRVQLTVRVHLTVRGHLTVRVHLTVLVSSVRSGPNLSVRAQI